MRWRLKTSHYLWVPGTQWEHKETTREGRSHRKLHDVPLLLDMNDETCYNYPGEIVVCHEGKGSPKDIVFIGEPTPDMEPMDDEAEKLSASLAHKWVHPIESLPGQGSDYGTELIKMFEAQMNKIVQAGGGVASIGKDANDERMNKLEEMVKSLMEQNTALQAQIAAKAPTERRA